jgi:PIN domain nuclease of toxin-antitoxin system
VKLLLDTHIWLWSLLEPKRLSRRVARELERPGNELWLSPVSVWEALVLSQKGRVALSGGAVAWIEKALAAAPLREAPFTHEVALQTARIQLPHRDPADRFLAATAQVYGLTLVTADRNLAHSKDLAVLMNN